MHLVGFIIRIYHGARSPERQNSLLLVLCYLLRYFENGMQVNLHTRRSSTQSDINKVSH